MSRKILTLAALAVFGVACTDREPVTEPAQSAGPEGQAPVATEVTVPKPERLARFVARALENPALRAYLRAQLDASPYREHKLHLRTLLGANDNRALRDVARANAVAEAEVLREAAAAVDLEIYLPVPAHRAAWTGDERVLVATAVHDREAPVAFDPAGRRLVLSPDAPPATPVIALVPVETNFNGVPQRLEDCIDGCDDGGGGGGDSPPAPPTPGLYMTKSHFVDDFEGWLKGNPEFEAHILGQKGQTDSLSDYQCAGEHAGGPYAFDQNGKDWSGRVLLFSKTQLDGYNAQHPGKNLRVFFVEDDDTACAIKANRDRLQELLKAVDAAASGLSAGNKTDSAGGWLYKFAQALIKLWSAAASFFNTNDELIGNAVEDDVVNQFYPGYNWFVKGENNVTNGWVNLETVQ